MKKLKTISLLIIALFFLNNTISAQNPTAFIFSGELLDIDANPIVEKSAKAQLEFSSPQLSAYTIEDNVFTNANGEFLLVINEIPEIFSDNLEKEKIKITVTLSSEEDWLEGGQFSITYFLNKTHNHPGMSDDSIAPPQQFEMSRFEGQDLNTSTINDVYKFSDSYAFLYLKSEFMMSMNPEIIDPESIIIVTTEASEQSDKTHKGDSIKSRGIKGAYAVGGYNKK